MKKTIFKLSLLFWLFIAGGAVSYAALNWCGDSYFLVGEKTYDWYTGSNSFIQPKGKFHGANLGILNNLYLGTQCQTADNQYGTIVTMNYKIDAALLYTSVVVDYSAKEGNNDKWQSKVTTDVLAGKTLTPGNHTVTVFLHANRGTDNVYDNLGGGNYIANFTYPGLVMPTDAYAFPNTIINASSIAKKVEIEGYGTTGDVIVSLSGTDADQFSLSATAVTLSENKGSFNVFFKPTTEGIKSAKVTISNGIYSQSFDVSAVAEPLPVEPAISGVLPTYNFGKLQVGAKEDQMFEVVGANLSEPITIEATGDVSQFALSANSLPAMGGIFTFTYQPTVVGNHSIIISFSCEGADAKTTTVTASSAIPLVVRFKKPSGAWGSNVSLHAWNAVGGILPIDFAAWPGKALSDDGSGWYSYTFPLGITSVDVIYNNKDAGHQSEDVVAITSSASYTAVSSAGTNPVKYKISTLTGLQITGKTNWSNQWNGQSISLSDPNSVLAVAQGLTPIVGDMRFTTNAISSSQIINNGTISVTGKVRTAITFSAAQSWQCVSLPYSVTKVYQADGVTEAALGIDGADPADYWVCEYDPAVRATGVSGWKFTNDIPLSAEKGYMMAVNAAGTLIFEGEGTQLGEKVFATAGSVDLNFTESDRTNDAGWNFVVQPNTANALLSLTENLIVYKQNGGVFDPFNHLTDPTVETIPFQSYFVKTADNTTASIDYGLRNVAKAAAQSWDILSLSLAVGQESYQTKVILHPDATADYNERFDAPKMFPFDNKVPQVWTNVGSVACDINTIESDGGTIAVSVRVPAAGSYSFSLSGDMYDLTVAKLFDKQSGQEISLLNGEVYAFTTAASGVINDRFELILSKVITDIVSNSAQSWTAFVQGSVLSLNDLPADASIRIANMTGRTVLSTQVGTGSYTTSLQQGIYLVSVNSEIVKINVSH